MTGNQTDPFQYIGCYSETHARNRKRQPESRLNNPVFFQDSKGNVRQVTYVISCQDLDGKPRSETDLQQSIDDYRSHFPDAEVVLPRARFYKTQKASQLSIQPEKFQPNG